MKSLFFTILFLMIPIGIYSQVSPVQGDVVFNTIDPRFETNGSSRSEFVVLVNRTNKQIDLNGFEVQTFAIDGVTEYSRYQWNSTYVLQPYTFLLISSDTLIDGISRDFELTPSDSGYWDDDGYVALRKQSPTQPSDYIDIVKHQWSNPHFTGVPLNSGLPITDNNTVNVGNGVPNSLATRGGVSGNINSLTYHFYDATDFTVQNEVTTPIQNSSSPTLPVELSSFSAINIKNGIELKWRTETEVSNYGFEILRSNQNDNWTKLGFVEGHGNSNSQHDYSFIDNNSSSGKFSYRLKQIDTDGKFQFSKTIEVDLDSPSKIELNQNYPNPFNPVTTIQYSIAKSGFVKLTVFNIVGEEVKVLVNEKKDAGVHTVNFDASNLNSGFYIYKIETNGFVQSKKMILLK